MHELSLLRDLMKKIDTIATDNDAKRVTRVRVKIGALAHISGSHFRGHFEDAARKTVAEGAVLEVEELTDPDDPEAQHIVLDSVDVE